MINKSLPFPLVAATFSSPTFVQAPATLVPDPASFAQAPATLVPAPVAL